jgi:hypothetical protein
MDSFAAQFVAAVLALGTNVARPSAALLTDVAFYEELCYLGWPERKGLNLSDALLLSRCVPKVSSRSSKENVEASSAATVSELLQAAKIGGVCRDLLGVGGFFFALFDATYMATLVQALPATGSCAGGCPFGRPLCKGMLGCVSPTCDDVKPLCNDNTDAGALARFMCGVTCGCGDLTSALLWIGPNSGCLRGCQEAARSKAEIAGCSDAQPSSTELAALVGYSRAYELYFAGWSLTNASVRAELGCLALNFDVPWLCDQEYFNASYGAKSLVPLCPVTCGCIEDSAKPGCPRTCIAPEPPRLHDLSDTQLALANKLLPSDTPPYPPSCFGVNATVCAALLTVWHKHPCPVSCDASRDHHNSTSMSSAPLLLCPSALATLTRCRCAPSVQPVVVTHGVPRASYKVQAVYTRSAITRAPLQRAAGMQHRAVAPS